MRFLQERWQFYLFLFSGVMMLFTAVVFLSAGEPKIAFACLLGAIASPGLMPPDYYSCHTDNPNLLIRRLAAWGRQSRGVSQLLCIAAIVLLFREVIIK